MTKPQLAPPAQKGTVSPKSTQYLRSFWTRFGAHAVNIKMRGLDTLERQRLRCPRPKPRILRKTVPLRCNDPSPEKKPIMPRLRGMMREEGAGRTSSSTPRLARLATAVRRPLSREEMTSNDV